MEKKETFAVCRALDVATTYSILQKGGTELNPIMASLMKAPVLYLSVQFLVVWYVTKHWEDLEKKEYKVALNTLNCIPALHNLGQF